MKSVKQEFLKNFVVKKLDSNESLNERFENCFKPLDKLCDEKIISSETCDLLGDTMISYGDLILEIIANCPFVEIKINQFNDQLVILD